MAGEMRSAFAPGRNTLPSPIYRNVPGIQGQEGVFLCLSICTLLLMKSIYRVIFTKSKWIENLAISPIRLYYGK